LFDRRECPPERAQEGNTAPGRYFGVVHDTYQAALASHEDGEFTAAVEGYRDVLAMAPAHVDAACNLGLLLHNGGEYEAAMAAYGAALAADPGHGGALRGLGMACYGQGVLQGAVDCYQQLLEQDPDDGESHYNLGVIFFQQGRLAEALASYARAVQANPANGDAWYNLGIAFKEQGELEEAVTCYESAIELNPDDADVQYNLGIVLTELGREEEGVAAFCRTLAIDPAYAAALSHLGVIYHRQGRFDEAIASYRQTAALGHNVEATGHILAALEGTTTEKAPTEYVRGLFDGFSERFDHCLLEELEYKTPMMLQQLLDSLLDGPASFGNVLDLGCGTGLSGMPFRPRAQRLTGVDLSEGMIAVARRKEVYDRLLVEEIGSFLKRSDETYDLLIATDVLVYVGGLDELFRAARGRLCPGAPFLFSTESCSGADYQLRTSGRYAHSSDYIQTLAEKHDFTIATCQAAGIRMERGKWIMGHLWILRARDAAAV